MENNIDPRDVLLKKQDEELSKIKACYEALGGDKANDLLAKYKALGTPEELEACKKKVDAYKDLGEPEDIARAFDAAEKQIDSMGTRISEAEEEVDKVSDDAEDAKAKAQTAEAKAKDLETSVSTLESEKANLETKSKALEEMVGKYSECGTPEEINTALDKLESYMELGSISDITALMDMAENMHESLQKYESLGTVDELNEICDKYEEIQTHEVCESLSETFNVTEEAIRNSLEVTGSVDKTYELFESLNLKKAEEDTQIEKPESAQLETGNLRDKSESLNSVKPVSGLSEKQLMRLRRSMDF